MPDYTDLSEANGWIPEPTDSEVLTRVFSTSAVEQVARRVNMTSRTVSVPRFDAQGVSAVPEHGSIPVQQAILDEVNLEAVKFTNRHQISIEDSRDSIVDEFAAWKLRWASNYSVALDNAALGVTAAKGAVTTAPYESVYRAVGSGGRLATAGALTYEDIVSVFGALEAGKYGDDLVVIAHPAFAMDLRNLKDEDGLRVVSDPLGAGVPTLFGHQIVTSAGARTSAAFTDAPTGNPLMVIGSRRNLILGVRDGIESAISDQHAWDTDHLEVKMRARRGFVVADPTAFKVIEKTAAV